MDSPTAPLDLTLSDLEKSKSRSLIFEGFYLAKIHVRPYVTINH